MLTGLSHAALMCLAYPRPYRLIKESRGGVHTGTRASFHKAKWLYDRFGQGEKIDFVETIREHGYWPEMRVPMVEWMNRWLGDPSVDHAHPELEEITVADLQVSPTGQVSTSYGSDRVVDICIRHLQEQLPRRASVSEPETRRRALSRQILSLTGMSPDWDHADRTPTIAARESLGRPGASAFTRFIVESEPEVFLPALMAAPESPSSPTIILCDDRGKAADDGALFQALAKARHSVVAVDLRGYGETRTTQLTSRDREGKWQAQLLGVENLGYAYGARHTGHTVIGMRILDLLQVVRALPDLGLSNDVILIGRGGCGLVALHAAVMLRDIRGLCLCRSLASYMDVAKGPLYRVPFTDMVPNALESYDLPELAASLAPVSLQILNPVDPMLEPYDEEVAAGSGEAITRAYAELGADENLTVTTTGAEAEETEAIIEWTSRFMTVNEGAAG